MSIVKYEIFESVIKTGSFTKAAEKLNRTQSAISHAISSLENELGVSLFLRDGRKISLTPHGIKAYTYICKILEINRKLIKTNFIDESFPKILKIGVFTSIKNHILPPVVKEFNRLYPFIEIIILEGTYDEIQEWIINKVIDFGFTINGDFGCESIPFLEDELVIATPSNLRFCLDDGSLNNFFNQNKIIMPAAPYKHQVEMFFNENYIVPNIHSYISDCNTIVNMISLGIGVSIGSKLFLKSFDNIKIHKFPVRFYRNIYIL
ncbi:LysR family transcriptional regulator [Xenorhabdus bovienii]|uniref:LysR family transcriptional regulator n=1 Tax=Xenorhabdus bovienii TaxID=40576 RepID=UPI0023B332C8|nr:LysR family transcriptional regulator [Xenorhabdus bovienii]MDE9462074.1 LysR family transcriptional regulator [Xenorhabdus bovienii]MDE9470030.1 LysR family transcriptional regulator [Xenorhabdus bovienii]